MALKNLFDMVKADRYTQDGREELIKAQEAEVEDRVYNIGEISQKTGLQKTANGWVKPKSGKQPGAKENDPLSPARRKAERIAKMQKATGKAAPYGRTLKGTPKTPDDNPFTERTQKRAAESKPASEGWEETRMASGKIYDLKSQGKRIIEQYDPETETKTFKLRDLNNSRTPDKEFKSLEEAKTAATKDKAPRVLTGDTRIRVRK